SRWWILDSAHPQSRCRPSDCRPRRPAGDPGLDRPEARQGRERQCCLWTVARPVTCARQRHWFTSARQLTGLTPPPTGPTPMRRLLEERFFLWEKREYE